LKHIIPVAKVRSPDVAPHAGAWIETGLDEGPTPLALRRPPCGGVD